MYHSRHLQSVCSVADHDFLACCSNDECLLVVLNWDLASFNELQDFLAEDCRLVLLNDMATVSYDMHFILALHMCDSQIRVHSFSTRKEKHLFCLQAQEAQRQAIEPLSPVLFCGQKICPPYKFVQASGLVNY